MLYKIAYLLTNGVKWDFKLSTKTMTLFKLNLNLFLSINANFIKNYANTYSLLYPSIICYAITPCFQMANNKLILVSSVLIQDLGLVPFKVAPYAENI